MADPEPQPMAAPAPDADANANATPDYTCRTSKVGYVRTSTVGGGHTFQALIPDERNVGHLQHAFKEDGQPGSVPWVAGWRTTNCPEQQAV